MNDNRDKQMTTVSVGAYCHTPQKYDPHRHHRRSIRLAGYDYSQAGAYFITICTQDRACLFGEIVDGTMRLNDAGRIVQQCWNEIPVHFPNVELDEFVIMPNHVHGIIVIAETPNVARHAVPLPPEQFRKPVPGSIPTIVRSFKSAVTKRINEMRGTPGARIWQRNYYEHIIRDEESLNNIREYIANNPMKWEWDRGNVQATHTSPQPSPQPKDEPWRI